MDKGLEVLSSMGYGWWGGKDVVGRGFLSRIWGEF